MSLDTASCGATPHFVLVPAMAQGHTIPMLHMARVLAGRGALVTYVTTPVNALRLDRTSTDATLPIRFLSLRFPCAEAGLPEGCESLDTLPGLGHLKNFLDGCAMLREPLIAHLRESTPPPSCVISDAVQPWTGSVARELGVPRLMFDGFCAFSSFCMHLMQRHKIFEGVNDDKRPVVIPSFPVHIEISRARSPGNFTGPGMKEFGEEIMEESSRADGVVVNSFEDLEPLFLESYEKAIAKKIWSIGPLFLSTVPGCCDANTGECMGWLEPKKPRSVVFVSFGSLARTSAAQLIEIGLGLEASNRPFIWVIKAEKSSEFEQWMSENRFEERVGERGLIIRGWAPQVMILSHPATGGFVTHCGWNSVLECVTMGLPMVTWPHFGEQFLNEKFVVEVLKIGVSIEVRDATQWGEETKEAMVTRDDVEKAVSELMDGGAEGKERRTRASELGKKARKAVEGGGSSYRNTTLLIQQIQAKTTAKSTVY